MIRVSLEYTHLHTFAAHIAEMRRKTTMNFKNPHSFHIPVMGLGYTIDTPLKVAKFGIGSVISIIEDDLVEEMRRYHCNKNQLEYFEIAKDSDDARAKRITAYLNLVGQLVSEQIEKLKKEEFTQGSDIVKYFEMLQDGSSIKELFNRMLRLNDTVLKSALQNELRQCIIPGDIDVNIMAKADRINYYPDGEEMSREYSDALSALRGFAMSKLNSSVVLSAGYNPVLYNYIDTFPDFLPDKSGKLQKKIILKVSDYRSALTQGKILAKKGVWISEYRIESGLNCGGHAFATEGKLLGPILNEFKENKEILREEILGLCNKNLAEKEHSLLSVDAPMKITVQGGIGTANENNFLLDYFKVDATGWGSPFLLVPEATNVDIETLNALATAKKEDYYLSNSSPLGIPIHSFRKSSSEIQRKARIDKGRPGSPCYKKYLSTNTEFTERPICTASREYQNLKLKQLDSMKLNKVMYDIERANIIAKDCLCEGLGEAARLKHHIKSPHKLKAVSICPGPNLAYFSGKFSLREMVDHIYGRIDILSSLKRSNMFMNELNLYVDHFKKELSTYQEKVNKIQSRHLQNFKFNLLEGVDYYKKLSVEFNRENKTYVQEFVNELNLIKASIAELLLPTCEEMPAQH